MLYPPLILTWLFHSSDHQGMGGEMKVDLAPRPPDVSVVNSTKALIFSFWVFALALKPFFNLKTNNKKVGKSGRTAVKGCTQAGLL